MTNSNETAAAVAPSPRALNIQQVMSQSFAAPMQIWVRPDQQSGSWTTRECEARRHEFNPVWEPDIFQWFNSLVSNETTEPQLKQLTEHQAVIAVVCEADSSQAEVVAGSISLDPWRWAQTVATLSVDTTKHAESNKLLEHYATRLSASFEELCFLRRLSKLVDYCAADRPSTEVARAILPEMRQLLEVESLCVVHAVQDRNCKSYRASSVGEVVGVMPISDTLCCQWIDRLGSANRRVLVKNYFGTLCDQQDVPAGLRSIVLAPIEKEGTLFGWLVGINKQVDGPVVSSPPNSIGYDEIGSMEATLLEASALMLGSHANNQRLFQDLETLIVGITHTLVGAIEARDAYTSGHSDRVAMMGRRLATELNLDSEQRQDVFLCGLLHDIGKIGIPDQILQKPGRLTDEEFAAIKTHPEIGARLLRGLKPLEKLLPGVLHHHESVDGTGYPHGLRGDEIPLMARILAVADAFDAMTSDRPYRDGMSMEKACSILRAGRGTQWDAKIVDAFFAAQTDMESICQHFKFPPTQQARPAIESQTPTSAAPLDPVLLSSVASINPTSTQ